MLMMCSAQPFSGYFAPKSVSSAAVVCRWIMMESCLTSAWESLIIISAKMNVGRTEPPMPLDAADNGVENNQLSEAIRNMNPTWNSDIGEDEAFTEAMKLAPRIAQIAVLEAEKRTVSTGKNQKAL